MQSSTFCCKIRHFSTPKNLRYFLYFRLSSSVVPALSCSSLRRIQAAAWECLHHCTANTDALQAAWAPHWEMLLPKLLPAFWQVWFFYNTQGLTWSRIYTRRWMKRPLRRSLWDMVHTLCLCLVALCVAKEEKCHRWVSVGSFWARGRWLCSPSSHSTFPLQSP